MNLETALLAFTTLFATISPVDVAALFAALTPGTSPKQRRVMALKGTLIAATILLVFAIFGNAVLTSLGIGLPALRTAGGILLLLISIDMVFARTSGGTSTTDDETEEAGHKNDISVFPLATPLIAGPGTMGAVILLMAQVHGDWHREIAVVGAIIATGAGSGTLGNLLAFVAVVTATVNVVGGFLVTDRMLGMFRKPKRTGDSS